jgi:quercetin dioxygenase-like cupin family protein
MAQSGHIIYNKAVGYKLQWIHTSKETDGKMVKFEMWVTPKGNMPVRHIHPRQTERIEVRSGIVKVECDGQVKILNSGEEFTIPQNKPHQWWNESGSAEADIVFTVEPALRFDTMMEQIFGISNEHGSLKFLQIMAMAKEYGMYVAGPPIVIQKIMRTILYPIAWILGYRKYYSRYSS